ncbi:MAG: response regulator transcription factor [Rhodospirillales bacterium]|nr:response regulator transcription factor [Rhodospirillales bacterium]
MVEDGWQVADALKRSLERLEMRVVGPAATSAEARQLASNIVLHLAIVDVNLNGEMAYALLDWLHSRGTPVVVTSGYEDLPESLATFAAILRKPFTAAALEHTLRQVVKLPP